MAFRRLSLVSIAVAFVLGFVPKFAHAQAVVPVVTSKSIPDATLELIDPETGISTGTVPSNVRLAAGDVILLRTRITPVAESALRGLQGYVTEYLPPNTELVGVRIIDANGNTLEPRYPGVAVDGCTGGATCNSFSSLPCSTGTCSFQSGSIAQVHADTGVFFSNDLRLARDPSDEFMTMGNGIVMSPEPSSIDPLVVFLLGNTSGTYYAHNQWDWEQIRAFGVTTAVSNTGGDGNTPHFYGSPVAGAETHYRYEATETSPGTIQFNNVTGPWTRVRYPGATTGTGVGNIGSSSSPTRALLDTTSGFDLTPSNPGVAKAVRIALGETRVGDPRIVELALRVTGIPLDPGLSANAACSEAFGSTYASKGANTGARDNAWPTYVGSPACWDLRLLLDLQADKNLVAAGGSVTHTLRGRNLTLSAETNAVVDVKYDPSKQVFVSADPAPHATLSCGSGSALTCLRWNLGTLAPSQEFVITAEFSPQAAAAATVYAAYRSDQSPAGQSAQSIVVSRGTAFPTMTLSPAFDPTLTFASAGSPVSLTGNVANGGTETWTQQSITFVLPSGWSVSGLPAIGGTSLSCSAGCGTARPTYNAAFSYFPGQSRTLTLNVSVPAATPSGLYRLDLQTWGSQGATGSFETYAPRVAFVPVGTTRTERPTLNCPIRNGAPAIDGTSEANAAIATRFNMIDRGSATASGGGVWTVSNYSAFGALYGGLEVTAVATAPGELASEPSLPCFVTNFDCTKEPAASTSGSYCEGDTIELFASAREGAIYSWTGPGGFTSLEQNPTISGATAAHAGTYSVTATLGGCTTPAETVEVVVNVVPAPVASNDGPFCEGAAISLTTPEVEGATYLWTGPFGFTSSQRAPVIADAHAGHVGTYSVVVTVDGCSSAGSTDVTMMEVPETPGEFTSGPISTVRGETGVPYAVPNVAGLTYQWSYSGSGVTINGSGNAVTLDFSSTATSGELSVIQSNACEASTPRTLQITVSAPFGPPPNFVANAVSTSSVSLSWTAVAGAAQYEIFRSHGGSAFAPLVIVSGTSHTDSGLSADTTYLYQVRTLGSGAPSVFTTADPATTVDFQDQPLNAGMLCKAVHVTQLRTAANAMRAAAGLPPAVFAPGMEAGSPIMAQHLTELRTAVNEARAAMGIAPATYADAVTAGSTVVKASHFMEIRAGVQ